ncbi:hypothetical protein NDU88_007404 [Pleurodeles waltl]|uniref:Uncharacterized protein n=1 Tax=Pleurodeles waltl TaxID=8319 RepID=A0AAV7P0R7_PLEWA|nr:hypothetical protein NDU88_007404 [Pleurodeles waltl]
MCGGAAEVSRGIQRAPRPAGNEKEVIEGPALAREWLDRAPACSREPREAAATAEPGALRPGDPCRRQLSPGWSGCPYKSRNRERSLRPAPPPPPPPPERCLPRGRQEQRIKTLPAGNVKVMTGGPAQARE